MHLLTLARPSHTLFVALALTLTGAGCGNNNGVASEDSARRAYLGIDKAIDRTLDLSMQGFNAASSANIPPQTANGDVTGTLTVDGHVDQGSSANKTLNVNTTFVTYRDTVTDGDAGTALAITYDSGGDAGTPPLFSAMLRGIPNGTFTGTYSGALSMSGDLMGTVTLALTINGSFEEIPGETGHIRRVAGSTHITGTATSGYGTYNIDLTR